MKKVVLLGCGFHGRGIAYQLARSGAVELRVLDRDEERARAAGTKAGVGWGTVDVTDPAGLAQAIAGADVVVNAVGPYHKTALAVIEAAIKARTNYVDMNDDHEVAEALLLDKSFDERAKRAGVAMLIDCGVVPGLSGMLVRYASDRLEETQHVAIRFGWNYSRQYPAAIQHFLRINSGKGPQYVKGRHERMPPFAGAEVAAFHEPVGRASVYYTGVPDPVAIARFIPGVETATAKGAFYQKEANRLLSDMVRWGFTSYEKPDASMPGPMDYLVGFLGSAAGAPYFEIERSDLPLAVQVEVSGIRAGKPTVLHYEAHDESRRATTTFTALAALAVARGELAPGIWAPEAWPRPGAFLSALLEDPHIRILHWRDGEPTRPLVIDDAGGH